MQKHPGKSPEQLRAEGPRPKKAPRWRDLSDEEQWKKIYEGREQKKAAAPRSVGQAVALALPGYVMQMAIDDCHKTFQATIRYDVHVSVVSSIAKVAAMLTQERKREKMVERLHKHFLTIKSSGFFLNNREFLYANAAAVVKLADDFRYPADSPACMAAIMLKEDAEMDEEGDWGLEIKHAVKMTGHVYDRYLDTELYRYPTAEGI